MKITGVKDEAKQLADELWEKIPDLYCKEITLPQPLVMRIFAYLRLVERW